MADLFGRADQVFNGGLTSDASFMYWGALANGGVGMLVQQMQIQYQQPVRRIYEIGPWVQVTGGSLVGQPVYYVVGRPEGQVSMARIAGPTAVLQGFYRAYGSPCNYLNSLFFVGATGCNQPPSTVGRALDGSAFTPPQPAGGGQIPLSTNTNVTLGLAQTSFLGWYMNGCIITSVGLSTQAQEMLISENVAMMFVGLKLYKFAGNDVLNAASWTEV